MENILRETSNLIKLRRRVVVYLPNKKVKTRQLAADLLNLPKHNQATCLDLFIDKPSKKPKDKPELRRAVALCNDRNADLIIPDLGTLAQSIHFLAEVSGLKHKLYGVTRPNGEIFLMPLDIPTLASISANIRKDVRAKTKARLQELKDQGVQLGSPDPMKGLGVAHAANRSIADDYARQVIPEIREIQALGHKTLMAIAKMLNARGVKTAKGGQFYATTVKNILDRSKFL
tara:strand:- start:9 stop:701 length:693 start_codon:yes stop_codon:yes gene_type:complete